MIYDAGVFIALDNPSKRGVVHALMRKMIADGVTPSTNEAVLAQAWRKPSKQVPMTMLLRTVDVYPFGDSQAIGQRCAAQGSSDVVDASLAVLADQLGQTIITTDPKDMAKLDVTYQTL